MSLTRGLVAFVVAIAISAGSSLAISAMAEDPISVPQAADVVWDDRPESVEELADDATVLVEARVAAIEDGPALTSSNPADDPEDEAIPTQRIAFETINVLDGQIPPTFKVFRTGSGDVYLQGDPFYAEGETYVLFLEPQGETGTWIPAAPDGRLEIDAQGEADPVIGGPVANELAGQTPEEIEEEAAE